MAGFQGIVIWDKTVIMQGEQVGFPIVIGVKLADK